MKRFRTKKFAALVAVAVVAAVAAVSAFAYFTSAGQGSGTATVGSASNIALSGSAVGDLYPGGADVPVTVDIHNAGSGSQHVGTISGAVATNGTCLGSWFQVDSVDYNADLAAGDSDSEATKVRMIDASENQDACQGKTLTINWSSN